MTKRSSDPLPYVQIDRAVKPKAAILAGRMGVTVQHALGSLMEWWELCGDPRELERIIQATPPGVEPIRLMSRVDVELRFSLASGHSIEAEVLVAVGLLEPIGESFRVRGMSRYFAPVASMLRANSAASIGGRSRIESARRDGSGRLISSKTAAGGAAGTPLDGRLDSGWSDTSRPSSGQPAVSQRSASDSPGENQVSDQRSAISCLKTLEPDAASGADSPALDSFDAVPPPKAKRTQNESRLRALQARLGASFATAVGSKYKFGGAKDILALKRMAAAATDDEIVARFDVGLLATGWRSVRTIAALDSKWNDLAPYCSPPSGVKNSDRRSCEACGSPPAPCNVWEHRLCLSCSGAIGADFPPNGTPDSLTQFTAEWVQARAALRVDAPRISA